MGLPFRIIATIIFAGLGIPLFFVGLLFGWLNDFWLMASVFVAAFMLPAFLIMLELNNRRNYPIRATLSYELGGERGQKNTYSTEDRIGYIDIKDSKGASTGAKEWKLMDINRPIQNFSYEFVGDKTILFGLRVVRHAHIVAVMGEKGEEFYPQRYDASVRSYKPVFDGDRGMRLFKIFQDIQNRNKYTDWVKQNVIQLVITGLAFMITCMLFLCFLQLTDVSKTLSASMTTNNACIAANAYFQNATGFNTSNTVGTATPDNKIAGIPFAFG